MCNFVNLRLWNSLYPDEDIYQIVDDGKWTLDMQNQYISEVCRDLNGNNQVDENDQLGFLYPHDLILLRMNIVKRIKVHTFPEIDRIEHPNLITVICEHFSALDNKTSFRKNFVKIKIGENSAFFVLFSIQTSNSSPYT